MYGHRWAAWRSSCEFRFATPLPRSQVALAFSSPILRPTAISLAAAADGTLQRAFADRSNDDGGDEGSGGSKIGIASGQDVDRGKIVFTEQIGQPTETPAQNHHVGGREGEREFLRRRVLVIARVWIGFQGVINQLAGLEAVAALLVEMELDAGAILDGGGIAVVFGGVHGVIEG